MSKKGCICAIIGKSIIEIAGGLDEKHYKCVDLKLSAANKLSEFIAEGVSGFVCNAEWGFSLFAIEILLGMRGMGMNVDDLTLICPFEEQATAWTDSVRERYFNTHAKADLVRFISRRYHEDCYRICEKVIIDGCDMLLTDDEGGFAAQYAEVSGKSVIACKVTERL